PLPVPSSASPPTAAVSSVPDPELGQRKQRIVPGRVAVAGNRPGLAVLARLRGGVAQDGGQGLQHGGAQGVVGPYATRVAAEGSGVDQDLQVMGDGGLGQAER